MRFTMASILALRSWAARASTSICSLSRSRSSRSFARSSRRIAAAFRVAAAFRDAGVRCRDLLLPLERFYEIVSRNRSSFAFRVD